MKRERLKKLGADVRRQFPPPRSPGKYRVVIVPSERTLSDEDLDRRLARKKRGPNEFWVVINSVKVTSRRREAVAKDVEVEETTSPAEARVEMELEAQVRRLERRKAELIAAGKTEGKTAKVERRRRRVDEIKRAARNAEDRRRRKI